jgi:hypothetical protein
MDLKKRSCEFLLYISGGTAEYDIHQAGWQLSGRGFEVRTRIHEHWIFFLTSMHNYLGMKEIRERSLTCLN